MGFRSLILNRSYKRLHKDTCERGDKERGRQRRRGRKEQVEECGGKTYMYIHNYIHIHIHILIIICSYLYETEYKNTHTMRWPFVTHRSHGRLCNRCLAFGGISMFRIVLPKSRSGQPDNGLFLMMWKHLLEIAGRCWITWGEKAARKYANELVREQTFDTCILPLLRRLTRVFVYV